MFEYRPVPKPSQRSRSGLSQRQKGEISQSVDRELRRRSQGICELCNNAKATERAHLTGRPHIDHKTTVNDLAHLCTKCHDWLDEKPEGIRAKRLIVAIVNYSLRKMQKGGCDVGVDRKPPRPS